MKTHVIILSSLFLFAVSLGAAAGQPAVLDVGGKTVQVGVKYYVVPVQTNSGGGLDQASTANSNCPKSVVQVGPNGGQGNAVVFSPAVNPKDGVVRNGTDVNVEFPDANTTGCSGSSKVWQITHDVESTDTTHYVVSGGQKGNPSSSTARNWFMLLKTKNGYKFKFCPVSLCDCNPVCQDIGISVEGGSRLLKVGSSLPTFEVNFKRA